MAKGKLVDTWKQKSWYAVLAPQDFDNMQIAELPAAEDALLINRIVEASLRDITGDASHAYTKLLFRVTDVKGKTAYTKLIGHELSRDYLKSLVRRRRSVLEQVVDAVTKDGIPVRLKLSLFSAAHLSGNARSAIRNLVVSEAKRIAKRLNFIQLEQEMLFGKAPAEIFNKAKKIAPIKRVEVRKAQVRETFAA